MESSKHHSQRDSSRVLLTKDCDTSHAIISISYVNWLDFTIFSAKSNQMSFFQNFGSKGKWLPWLFLFVLIWTYFISSAPTNATITVVNEACHQKWYVSDVAVSNARRYGWYLAVLYMRMSTVAYSVVMRWYCAMAWAQFCCKMWWDSLVWNQYSRRVTAEVGFYKYRFPPNLVSTSRAWDKSEEVFCFEINA